MNVNSKRSKKQADNNVPATNVLSQEEYNKRIATIIGGMKTNTWKDLETKGKFAKNDKLTFIDDDSLIVGCDIGSEKHYIRAIDTRGRELSSKALSFVNNEEGFLKAKKLDAGSHSQK
jgi:hypothetical protein